MRHACLRREAFGSCRGRRRSAGRLSRRHRRGRTRNARTLAPGSPRAPPHPRHSLPPRLDAIQHPVAEIAPFRGTRYDPSAVDDLSLVVSPPYDVITEADREALEAGSPYNVVRLVLGRDEPGDDERSNKYTRARGLLEAWHAAGVLREDVGEALYVYEQRYRLGDEKRFQRGVLGAVRLDEPEAGGVLPHERTYG